MNKKIKAVYCPIYLDELMRFVEPYSLTGSFKTLKGDKIYFLNGKYHRKDGPAIEHADGDKWWYFHGTLHREDGPAVERADGEMNHWYLGGTSYTETEYNARIKGK